MNRIKTAAVTAAVAVTAFGAYSVCDRIPKVDPGPANASIANLQILQGSSTAFDAAVKKPAGIAWMADSATYLGSTDNRVAAEISADYSNVLSEITIAGMAFEGGHLVANSEAFGSVLMTDVHGINNINQASGLTVRGDQLVLKGDAENYLPKPSIYLANLPV